jgi:NADH/NAD ratio-sensing transcriptional regulator Rex
MSLEKGSGYGIIAGLPSQKQFTKTFNLTLLGFGNVGRALAKLSHDKRAELREK